MTLSPALIPVYSHRSSEKSLRVISYIAYLWLAFLVIFFPTGVILDLYNLIIKMGHPLIDKSLSDSMISAEKTLFFPLLLSLIINTYGYFEARFLCMEHLVMKSHKIPEGVHKVRVAQVSDIHLGIIVRDKLLSRVIKKVNAEKPDIVVSTGDLVDGTTRHINHLIEILKNIHAPLGRYAVMGNHEIYGGAEQTAEFIEKSGFTLLRGEGLAVNGMINIAGVDFKGGETGKSTHVSSHKSEAEMLSKLPDDLFTILLKHRASVDTESLGLFDLQLSGHTHKGQIFPVSLATMFLFQFHAGFTKLPKGSTIHVSRGTGTSGPPIRFLSRPEITIIDIVSE
jgi:predicted MPP superfamily phosphohydrolase